MNVVLSWPQGSAHIHYYKWSIFCKFGECQFENILQALNIANRGCSQSSLRSVIPIGTQIFRFSTGRNVAQRFKIIHTSAPRLLFLKEDILGSNPNADACVFISFITHLIIQWITNSTPKKLSHESLVVYSMLLGQHPLHLHWFTLIGWNLSPFFVACTVAAQNFTEHTSAIN